MRFPARLLSALLLLSAFAGAALAESRTIVIEKRTPVSESRRSSWKKRWVWSVVAVAAATALDAHSSMGRYEANPLLRNSRGQFSSSRGFAIKAASSGGMIALEAFLARKNPEVYRSSAYVNFVSAGAFSAVAIRNRLTK